MNAITSMSTAACEQLSILSKNVSEVSIWMGKNIVQISQSAFEIGTVCYEKASQIAGSVFQAADTLTQHAFYVGQQAISLARAVVELARPHFEQVQNIILENRSHATAGFIGAAIGITTFIALRSMCCTRQSGPREINL